MAILDPLIRLSHGIRPARDQPPDDFDPIMPVQRGPQGSSQPLSLGIRQRTLGIERPQLPRLRSRAPAHARLSAAAEQSQRSFQYGFLFSNP
jgi:hypothetical protein